ncbi:hypothetical protein RYX36_009386, partial [Vicia faba]
MNPVKDKSWGWKEVTIIQSTGTKDRHSKICNAKGPRNYRVRILAYITIQFYDMEGRSGYDQPELQTLHTESTYKSSRRRRRIVKIEEENKIYNTNGPHNYRVRLPAHITIQFYDMQGRLGYDRP